MSRSEIREYVCKDNPEVKLKWNQGVVVITLTHKDKSKRIITLTRADLIAAADQIKEGL